MARNAVVVGGGTAGRMTNSYLRTTFSDRSGVTRVKSNNVTTVSVGETAFSTVRHFSGRPGLGERDDDFAHPHGQQPELRTAALR